MSSTVGPVCHIPPTNTPGDPQPTNIPGIPAPAQANLQSLQATINGLRQLIIYMAGQQGTAGQNGKDAKSKPARWTEKPGSRVTSTVRVFQNNDSSSQNWVDIEQINQVTMADGVTGESWVWKRGS